VTADYEAVSCLGCHAPAPLGREGEIALRADHREEGVTCVSCHLVPDADAAPLTMRGPHARTSPILAHPIAVDALFTKPDLCGTCHVDVLEQWREALRPPTDPTRRSVSATCRACIARSRATIRTGRTRV
jgi:hypothetical protein